MIKKLINYLFFPNWEIIHIEKINFTYSETYPNLNFKITTGNTASCIGTLYYSKSRKKYKTNITYQPYVKALTIDSDMEYKLLKEQQKHQSQIHE